MGEWGNWGEFTCSNVDDDCGKCKRERKKFITKECKHGGDCSCKEEKGEDKITRPCRK